VPVRLQDRGSIDRAMETVAAGHDELNLLVAKAVRWPTEATGRLVETDHDLSRNALRGKLDDTTATGRAALALLRACDSDASCSSQPGPPATPCRARVLMPRPRPIWKARWPR
jgi:hypothetical protein